jgi:hypothetical protein
MYHPELYPELAKNNIKATPLKINQDITRQAKMQETNKKNAMKAADREIRVVDKLKIESRDRSEKNLRNLILRSWKTSNVIHPQHATSRFDIDPIFSEMHKIASQFMMPNYEVQNEKRIERLKYAMAAEEKGLNPFPLGLVPDEEQTFNLEEFVDRDSTSYNTYSAVFELYAKHVKDNQKVELRDLMQQMKKDQLMSPHLDIRSVPSSKLSQNERVYLDEEISQKVELEEVLSKIDNASDEDLIILLDSYEASSKEDLRNKINEAISKLDSDITMKYLKFGDKIEETNNEEESAQSTQA